MAKHVTKARARARRRHQAKVVARDRFTAITQRVAVIGTTSGVIWGQAELFGEPTRHIVTVACVLLLAGAAFWMKET